MVKHAFGGHWTEVKLELLRSYIKFYTTALKNKPFKKIYIDAFAGSGERHKKIEAAPILNEEEIEITYDGSAKIALQETPPFDHYYFIEKNSKRFKRLKEIILPFEEEGLNITLFNSDANEHLKTLCEQIEWHSETPKRAVVFLDPYGLGVDWDTLQAIRDTKATDLFFLFSLSGLARNASIDFDAIEDYKLKKINQILGTEEWQELFYRSKKDLQNPVQNNLFDDEFEPKKERTATVKEMEGYIKKRLETIFPFVEEPFALPPTGSQLYSLFFCLANPNPKAIGLARKMTKFLRQEFPKMWR